MRIATGGAMKKYSYSILFIIMLGISFLAGSWYNHVRTERMNPPGPRSVAVNPDEGSDTSPPGTVMINHEKQQMTGVRTGVVKKAAVTRKLRLLGKVAPDETRIFKIKAAVDGIIGDVYPCTTGSMVKKEQPLASFYSPDIYAAEQGFLIAASSARSRSNLQVQVTESRLRFLGMSPSQIQELGKKGEIEENIVLRSPATGFVLSREVSRELRFQKGDELYRIAELDRVWIFADVYENEAGYIRPGVPATVKHPGMGKEFQARVSDVLSLFDATTRTLKVRLEADNPGFLLKPDMYVDIELPISLPPAIAVPADAVLDSGLKKTVFVDLANGFFEPREVETGWRFDNQVEIKKGLSPGERIVMSGTFLIDSESRLELAAAGMYRTLSKDPVCGLDVSINKAVKTGRKAVYKGKAYYFSSDESKLAFDKNPKRYAEEKPR